MIDASDSINDDDFKLLKQSMSNFIDHLHINSGRMGIVVYSTRISLELPLTGDKVGLQKEALKLPHDKEGTNTDLGIQSMTNLFKRDQRPGVPMLGFVLTDGRSKTPSETARQAQLARTFGINMYAIGIGSKIDDAELQAIASAPSQVMRVASFASLADSIGQLVMLVCPSKYA